MIKNVHFNVDIYNRHSVLSEPGTDDSGLYRRAKWNLSVYYPDGHLDRQLHHRLSVFCGFLHFLFDLCVCGGFHFDEGAVCLRQRHAGGQCSRTHGSGIGGAGNPGKVYGTLMNRLKA